MLAEFLGTFVLILLGDGSVAMTVAALNQSGRGTKIFEATGDWLLITWGWGFAVVFGVYVAGGVSGAHLNPAVTLAFAVRRGFAWAKVPWYMLAQLVGAFVAAALVYAVYHQAIGSYEAANHIVRGTPESLPTYSIFATFPAKYFGGVGGPFLDQVVGTAILVGLIFALVDERNSPPGSNLAPFIIGMVVTVIGMTFGANAGYAINPARDLGPRLWAWIEGWGSVAIPGNYSQAGGAANISGYMWVPIVGPLVGALVGAVVYDWFIRDILRARGEKKDQEVEARGRTVQEKDDLETRGRTVQEEGGSA
jgi:glycerol uptake facilitator protein